MPAVPKPAVPLPGAPHPAAPKSQVAAPPPASPKHPENRHAGAPKPRPKLAPLVHPKGPSTGGGQPLAPHIKEAIQNSLLVDLGAVRLHASTAAERKAQSLSARAFTFGNDIFLGKGEHPTDLTLISHEAAHVIQQQSAPAVQTWSPDRSDRYEREADQAAAAVQRSEPFAVRERVDAPRVQRLGISDALDYFADKANNIPGYRMFTIFLGVNPINMQPVERSAANVLRAVVEFIPGGGLITQALDKYGVFDKVGNWVQEQLDTLAMTGSSIKKALMDFLDSLSWSDIFHLGDVWDRATRIFTEPIDRIKNFVKGFVEGIWKFLRDAILKPIAKLAEGTAGWPLLTAVLGRNPITGEAVPRTPETLIGGFMKLIHQDEIWNNLKKSNAVSRAWAWFQGVLSGLLGFVSQIPDLFIQALKSLEWSDVINLPQGFMKLVGVFGKFLGNFTSWAGGKIWDLLQIIFEVVAPAAMPYLKKVGAAFKGILQNPMGFVRNLVAGAKLGFVNFGSHFLKHLQAGLIDWLTGSLPGVYIPKALSLIEFGKFALSVLGISWAQIRGKIVKVLGANGETIMKGLETGFDVVVALVKGGPAAAWDLIKEKLTDLKDTVMSGITSFVIDTIVQKAIPKLISMFIPGAGFISAIVSIYDTIKTFLEKLSKIMAAVKAFLDSIVAIAAGQIEGAANKVESTLAGLLSLAISFLAGFLGLGSIASKVLAVIEKVRAMVDKGIDTAIAWIVGKAKALFAKLFGKKDTKDDGKDGLQIKLATPLDMDGEGHTIFTEVRDNKLVVEMASSQRQALLGLTAQAMAQTSNEKAKRKLQTVWEKLKSAEDKVATLISDRTKDAETLALADKMTQDAANQLKSIGKEFDIPSLLVPPHKSTFVQATVTGYSVKPEYQTKIRDRFYPSDYDPDTLKWKMDYLERRTVKGTDNFLDEEKRSEPKSQATIDHQPRVVEHWEAEGKKIAQSKRAAWYRKYIPGHMFVVARKYNSSDGAQARISGLTYKPDNIGKDFSGPSPDSES